MCQETHSTKDCEKIWQAEWGGNAIFSHGTSAARGICILYKKEFRNSVKNIYTDEEGRVIIIDILDNDQIITLVALYAPNQDSPEFFKKVNTLIKERSENKIVIGDFNLVLDIEQDRLNTYNNNSRAREIVESMMDEFCLKDIWRIQNPDKKEYSWRKSVTEQKASRIDFALVSGGLDQKIKKLKTVQYLPGIQTDHRAMYLIADLAPSERGAGYWKFNNSLLQDINFCDKMRKEITKTCEANMQKEPCHRWEILKKRIKTVATNYSRQKAVENKIIISNLSEKVNEYESTLPLNEKDDKLLQEKGS